MVTQQKIKPVQYFQKCKNGSYLNKYHPTTKIITQKNVEEILFKGRLSFTIEFSEIVQFSDGMLKIFFKIDENNEFSFYYRVSELIKNGYLKIN